MLAHRNYGNYSLIIHGSRKEMLKLHLTLHRKGSFVSLKFKYLPSLCLKTLELEHTKDQFTFKWYFSNLSLKFHATKDSLSISNKSSSTLFCCFIYRQGYPTITIKQTTACSIQPQLKYKIFWIIIYKHIFSDQTVYSLLQVNLFTQHCKQVKEDTENRDWSTTDTGNQCLTIAYQDNFLTSQSLIRCISILGWASK